MAAHLRTIMIAMGTRLQTIIIALIVILRTITTRRILTILMVIQRSINTTLHILTILMVDTKLRRALCCKPTLQPILHARLVHTTTRTCRITSHTILTMVSILIPICEKRVKETGLAQRDADDRTLYFVLA